MKHGAVDVSSFLMSVILVGDTLVSKWASMLVGL